MLMPKLVNSGAMPIRNKSFGLLFSFCTEDVSYPPKRLCRGDLGAVVPGGLTDSELCLLTTKGRNTIYTHSSVEERISALRVKAQLIQLMARNGNPSRYNALTRRKDSVLPRDLGELFALFVL